MISPASNPSAFYQSSLLQRSGLAAAGSLAMGGPDGKQYAIGGSVNIDTSPGNTPEETIRKASQMRASALAPADPSPQDLKVAAKAVEPTP